MQTSFYISERKKRNILIDNFEKPLFGKWTFDTENRKKYPEKKTPPSVKFPAKNKYITDAEDYIKANFSDNFGEISDVFSYPIILMILRRLKILFQKDLKNMEYIKMP